MLDPHALRPALDVAHHLGLQPPWQAATGWRLAAEEPHHVRAEEGGQAVLHQPGIQMRQRRRFAEHDVGGPLALIGGPVVLHGKRGKHRRVQRVQAARDLTQQHRPVGADLPIHQVLCPLGVFQPGEAVVAL